MRLKATTNGAFGKALEARRQKWAGGKSAAARIEATDNIDWWYYLEFGVGPYKLKADPLGVFTDEQAAIWRKHAGALSFDIGGRHIITDRIVNHPGIPAKHLITDARPDIIAKIAGIIKELAPQIPDNPQLLNSIALAAAQEAKAIIRASIQQKLGAPNRGEGKSAAELFDEKTDVAPRE